MAWTSPMTAVSGAVLTAAQWNTHVRDNLLETAPAKATGASHIFVSTGVNSIAERSPEQDFVDTPETTASTTYTALATAGPAVPVTCGSRALALISGLISNNTAGANSYMTTIISGATSISGSDVWALQHRDSGVNGAVNASRAHLFSGLTPGSHTFNCTYRVSGGTGTFDNRHMLVVPL